MVKESKKKFRLKGHESFYIRDGWLRKGMKNIQIEPLLFAQDDVVDRLAVGANMVKAIRYWLYATNLVEEKQINNGKREQRLTKDLGEIINKYDPYFEDVFSLWLLHYNMVSNTEICTSWYLFFNKFTMKEFTKEEFNEAMENVLEEYIEGDDYSKKSLHDDCNTIIRTYIEEEHNRDPEDNLTCPLSELGLLKQYKNSRGKIIYTKSKPDMGKLPPLFVMYMICKLSDSYAGIPIDILIESDNNLGKLLNFDRMTAYQYLEELRKLNLIQINRTAGLDMIYPKDGICAEQILHMYYGME